MGPVRTMEELMAVGHGHQRSMILFAALKAGVFRGLAKGPCGAPLLARRIGADPGKLAILLDALVALGLVGKHAGMYRNTGIARDLLLPGPRSIRGANPASGRKGSTRRTSSAGWRRTRGSGRRGSRGRSPSGRGSGSWTWAAGPPRTRSPGRRRAPGR